MENSIVKIFENEYNKRQEEYKNPREWGLSNVRILTRILEENGATISSHMWDLLLFKVNGLRINENKKVCYLSFDKPSKRILELFARYNNVIIDNFDKITKGR